MYLIKIKRHVRLQNAMARSIGTNMALDKKKNVERAISLLLSTNFQLIQTVIASSSSLELFTIIVKRYFLFCFTLYKKKQHHIYFSLNNCLNQNNIYLVFL